jgi:hypothetical protein
VVSTSSALAAPSAACQAAAKARAEADRVALIDETTLSPVNSHAARREQLRACHATGDTAARAVCADTALRWAGEPGASAGELPTEVFVETDCGLVRVELPSYRVLGDDAWRTELLAWEKYLRGLVRDMPGPPASPSTASLALGPSNGWWPEGGRGLAAPSKGSGAVVASSPVVRSPPSVAAPAAVPERAQVASRVGRRSRPQDRWSVANTQANRGFGEVGVGIAGASLESDWTMVRGWWSRATRPHGLLRTELLWTSQRKSTSIDYAADRFDVRLGYGWFNNQRGQFVEFVPELSLVPQSWTWWSLNQQLNEYNRPFERQVIDAGFGLRLRAGWQYKRAFWGGFEARGEVRMTVLTYVDAGRGVTSAELSDALDREMDWNAVPPGAFEARAWIEVPARGALGLWGTLGVVGDINGSFPHGRSTPFATSRLVPEAMIGLRLRTGGTPQVPN